MRIMILSLIIVVASALQAPQKPLSDDDWRLLSRAIYKCGQIKADIEWIHVIDASHSIVAFTIDRTKSERDWIMNHCDEVLHIAEVPKGH